MHMIGKGGWAFVLNMKTTLSLTAYGQKVIIYLVAKTIRSDAMNVLGK